ncbi:hypothetical protein ACFQ0K_08875 [Nocardioides caeni]|uniref:Uncharacterized protein n=1 Tax=Nocardioides caeni TaxID=574700 RepID=A0A4S8N3B8_9ACTN|nr:hypothetical protein [Nocardioides caeni]THV10507.1 hypothetical protein E9934_14370 [Nocardioides caeni]
MTWTETHRRWQILRAVEELLNQQLLDGEAPRLPWTPEYDELFGDRAGLIAALRYRWELAASTQLDQQLPEHVVEEQRHRLLLRSRGVLRLLDTVPPAGEGVTRVVA